MTNSTAQTRLAVLVAAFLLGICSTAAAQSNEEPLRIGIIGLDTSHSIAFTEIINNPENTGVFDNAEVVAAYPKGSLSIESSASRIPEYTAEIEKMGIDIVDSIQDLLPRVDAVLLETNDGRRHLEQVLPVLKAGKPVFIDKPLAASLVDAVAIFEAAEQFDVPVFSSSPLRFEPLAQKVRNDSIGRVVGAHAYSPAEFEKTHSDFFWYGIHGVETLYTMMGPGCVTVQREHTAGTEVVVGRWAEGRIGTFRGIREGTRGYGGTAFGTDGKATFGSFHGYRPLVEEIVTFFRTGEPPVSRKETIELYAFMEAADESKRLGGRPVTIESVLSRARAEAHRQAKAWKSDRRQEKD